MNIDDFAGILPDFEPDEFFNARMIGWAILEGPLGGLQRRASLKALGRKKSDGTFAFSETWTFDDGHTDQINWLIKPLGGGKFEGTEPTLDGNAEGIASGCAFHWTYPVSQGRSVQVHSLPTIDLGLPVERKMIGIF